MSNNSHKYDALYRVTRLAEKVLINSTRLRYALIILNLPIVISCSLLIISLLQIPNFSESFSKVFSMILSVLAGFAVFLDFKSNVRIQYMKSVKEMDFLSSKLKTLYTTINNKIDSSNYQEYHDNIEKFEDILTEEMSEFSFQVITEKYASKVIKKKIDYHWIDGAKSYINFLNKQNSKNA